MRSAASSVLMPCASSVVVFGRVPGEGEEDLVEARLAEREVGQADAVLGERGDRLGAAVGVRARTLQRGRVGLELDEAELAREDRLGLGALLGVEQADVQRAASRPTPSAGPGVPSAITWPWSITAIPSASWSASSRYCVQSRIVVPSARSARMMSQTWLRERGSSPVVGSSRNISSGVTTMLAAMSSRRRMPPE